MKISNTGTVPVYTVAGASRAGQLPEWISRKKRKSKSDPEEASRIELLNEFSFPGHSTSIKVSEDGNWIMSTGAWQPQIHTHDLSQLALSWSRHVQSSPVTFSLLSADASKSVHLLESRTVELHSLGGCDFVVRLPRFGRDLVYDRLATEALIPSVGLGPGGKGEVFRLNLELGRFMQSYPIDIGADEGVERGLQGSLQAGSVNTATIAEDTHGLLAFGTSLGTVELWDPRSRARAATLRHGDGETTALQFGRGGLSLSLGTSNGNVSLYDLRRPTPLLTKEMGFGFSVKKLLHLVTSSGERKILSADQRIIKIFDEVSGEPFVSIEPDVQLNDVAVSGSIILSANEGSAQHAWFIPALGPAPPWCPYLDNIVEEMEQTPTETYENYRFQTIPELRALSLDHLIGKTNLLRPYMHGYFVASKLYDQARLIANPYVWEEERIKRVKEKVEKERATRIRGNKKVKVNQKLVDRLLKRQEKRDQVDTEAGVLGDERFKGLFENEDFVVDENSREFRALNPSTRVDGQAGGTDTNNKPATWRENSSDDLASDEERPIRNNNDVVMRVSSSTEKQRVHQRDTAFGSRTPKSGRADKVRRGKVSGERTLTFTRESKPKGKQTPRVTSKRSGPRRSASGNTFRKL